MYRMSKARYRGRFPCICGEYLRTRTDGRCVHCSMVDEDYWKLLIITHSQEIGREYLRTRKGDYPKSAKIMSMPEEYWIRSMHPQQLRTVILRYKGQDPLPEIIELLKARHAAYGIEFKPERIDP